MKTAVRALAVLLVSLGLLVPALPAGATVWDYQETGDPADVSSGMVDITSVRVSHVYENGRQFARVRMTFRNAADYPVGVGLRWTDAGGDTYILVRGRRMGAYIQRLTGSGYRAGCECSLSGYGTRSLTVTIPWWKMNLDKQGGPAHISGLRGHSYGERHENGVVRPWAHDATRYFGTLY